jgi:hypothetical protein
VLHDKGWMASWNSQRRRVLGKQVAPPGLLPHLCGRDGVVGLSGTSPGLT